MPNLRAFVLDPSDGPHNRAGPLRDLATSHFSWSWEQIDFEETQIDPGPVLARVRTALETCDVLIGLGDFFLFAWLGESFGDEYVKLVQNRMHAGMPALFQLPRAFDRFRTGQIATRVERIFRDSEVFSTNNRVYSEHDYYEGHSSPMSCWFRKSDGCLLNPELFTGIDRLLMSSTNLLAYDGDTFPIVEAGPLHLFVDAGDLPSKGILGQKNAVAVLRRTATEFSIFLGGSALDAPTKTLGGILPGIEMNQSLALKILKSLHEAAQGNRYLNQAYSAFSRLERDLGKMINDVLRNVCGSDQIEKFFPQRVIDHTLTKTGIVYALANYDDLIEIILHSWEYFQNIFEEISKNTLKKRLQSLNYKYRRHLAHPHKAEQEGFVFKDIDVNEIQNIHAMIQRAMKNIVY